MGALDGCLVGMTVGCVVGIVVGIVVGLVVGVVVGGRVAGVLTLVVGNAGVGCVGDAQGLDSRHCFPDDFLTYLEDCIPRI